jgi:hypothetical protein
MKRFVKPSNPGVEGLNWLKLFSINSYTHSINLDLFNKTVRGGVIFQPYLLISKELDTNIGCSFKSFLQVGVEESIVNASRITDHGSAV